MTNRALAMNGQLEELMAGAKRAIKASLDMRREHDQQISEIRRSHASEVNRLKRLITKARTSRDEWKEAAMRYQKELLELRRDKRAVLAHLERQLEQTKERVH